MRADLLTSLEKLILSVYLLEVEDVVADKELPEIFKLEFPVLLQGKDQPNETPVFQVIHRRPPSVKRPQVSRPAIPCRIRGG